MPDQPIQPQRCEDPTCQDCERVYGPVVENEAAPISTGAENDSQVDGYQAILNQILGTPGSTTAGLSNFIASNTSPRPTDMTWETVSSPTEYPVEFTYDEVRSEAPVEYLDCYWCGRTGTPGRPLNRDESFITCQMHTRTCEAAGCELEIAYPHYLCAAHAGGTRDRCTNCGDSIVLEDTTFSEYYGGNVCDGCFPSECNHCGYQGHLNDNGFCEECWDYDPANIPLPPTSDEGEGDEETNIEEADLLIPSIPGRENVRKVGIEIEGGGNWRTLAGILYTKGLTEHQELGGYHELTQGRGSGAKYWSLERDSSVDWELVSPPLNIADRAHVRQLREVLQTVQQGIKSKEIWFDLRCGLHIHVGAEKAGIAHAWRLGVVWGFLEDLIFRLGAAKWPMHRSVRNGLHYCQPTPKGAKSKLAFGRQMDHDMDRYNALSFSNYISSFTRNCTCGAVRYDSWDECECSLGKCTFEFRVFNTSANMHKVHAYMALCQAMVAWATSDSDINADDFEANEWTNVNYNDLSELLKVQKLDGWKAGLTFIFNELPLTKGEKLNLIYCIENSEAAAVGEDFVRSLNLSTTEEVAIA